MNIFILLIIKLLSSDDYRSDMDDNHDLVADIDSDTLTKIVKFLMRG